MKRMIPFIFIAMAGLGVCGWLVLRHSVRTASDDPSTEGSGLPAPRKVQAIDRWQDGIRLDQRTDYVQEPKATKDIEKLRKEELRQKPWEGRN